MANEVFKGLFGFSPEELTQQRQAENDARAFQMAQLSPLQQTSYQGFKAAQGVGDSLRGIGQKLFNIEDPQMKESALLDSSAKELFSQGIDPMSSKGLTILAERVSAAGGRPETLQRLLSARQQAALQEAKVGTEQAQGAKYNADAKRIQEEAAREEAMRAELAALPPDATDEQRYAVIAKYGSPDKMLAGIDYRTRLTAEKEARIEQANLRHQQRMEELRLAGADRAAIAAENRAHQLEMQRMRSEDRADARAEKTAEKKAVDAEKRQQMIPAFDSALATLDRIDKHPGKKAGVGFGGSQLSLIPGTDAAGFRAQLETFKAQTFLPMVASLKGMGALSDAEGKKLTDAVGALSPDMPEKEFNAQIAIIRKDLNDAKARAAGKTSTAKPAQRKTQGGIAYEVIED